MESILRKIWHKYDQHYSLYSGITTGIFLLQIFHLYWLTMHVVLHKAFGIMLFDPGYFLQLVIIFVDYLEIPAILGTSLLYIHALQKKWNFKDMLLLLLINSQWLHIFWISDEFVLDIFAGQATETIFPIWLAWVAIGIDYLELPVMYDTTKKFITSLWKP